MLPTAFKSKIPKTHAYPVGSELLSEALSSAPQIATLTLNFYGLWASKDKSNLQPVLEVNHTNIRENQFSSKSLVTQGFYNETWAIIVYPVRCEQKAEVKRFLVAEGLPKVKAWLSAKRSATWLEGRRTLSLSFDEVLRSLKFVEDGNM